MEQHGNPLRIALIMDKGLYREALAHLIRTTTPHTVATELGESRTYEEACARTAPPHIAIVDLSARPQEGLERIAWIGSHQPATLPLACGDAVEQRWVRGALQAGSRGYLPSDSTVETLHAAVEQLVATREYSTPLVQAHRERMAAEQRGRDRVLGVISPREWQILRLLFDPAEMGYKQMADKLSLSPRTVQWHCGNLMEKLGVSTRTGLLLTALRFELVNFQGGIR
ncbi:MAG: response regulator transcription factor [Flavobacteriales bacterium]|nr:response regulator transcription factor [Flavobacteriales bacterium]